MPGLACAYVHGSFGTVRFRAESDVDVGLLFYPKLHLPRLQLMDYAGRIEARIGHPVHFGIMSTKNVVFVKEVIAKGRRVFCADRTYCDTFVMHALSMYVRLNEERDEVLKSYAA
jgi:predicted nucleotidyltransferase